MNLSGGWRYRRTVDGEEEILDVDPDWYKQVQNMIASDVTVDASVKKLKRLAEERGFDSATVQSRLFGLVCDYVDFTDPLPSGFYDDSVEYTKRLLRSTEKFKDIVLNFAHIRDEPAKLLAPAGEARLALRDLVEESGKKLLEEHQLRLELRWIHRGMANLDGLVRVCIAFFAFTGERFKYADLIGIINVGLKSSRRKTMKRDTLRKTVTRFRLNYPRMWEWLVEETFMTYVADLIPPDRGGINWDQVPPGHYVEISLPDVNETSLSPDPSTFEVDHCFIN